MEMYKATISETSFETLTNREKLLLTDFTNAVKIDDVVNEHEKITISPVNYAIVDVTNPRAKGDTEYSKLVIIDDSDTKFQTSSKSLTEAFIRIHKAMCGESYEISVYGVASKNYQGKKFLTCSIV